MHLADLLPEEMVAEPGPDGTATTDDPRLVDEIAGLLQGRRERWQQRGDNDQRFMESIGRVTLVWWVEPFLLMVIGVSLGLSDQAAVNTSNDLRVPALIAALLLAGQGLKDYLEGRDKAAAAQEVRRVRQHAGGGGYADDEPPADTPPAPPRPWYRGASLVGRSVPSRATSTVAFLLMVLAVWLGLAVLTVTSAPAALGSLSLVASFLLFAFGWKTLTETH